MSSTFTGSPIYMAPELIKDRKYGQKADIWAFGVSLYEIICLNVPFYNATFDGLF